VTLHAGRIFHQHEHFFIKLGLFSKAGWFPGIGLRANAQTPGGINLRRSKVGEANATDRLANASRNWLSMRRSARLSLYL
jgi:hypothetical protein